MDLAPYMNASETRMVKAVFPNTTNHYDTLFGGQLLEWMDEMAFITATRFSRQRTVTVATDGVEFNKPIPAGTIVELVGRVVRIGRSSMQVCVDVYVEQMYEYHREKATCGVFTMVTIDEDRNPTAIKLPNLEDLQ